MVATARIAELWRYPVKSLGGERLQTTEITGVIPGDRGWGIVDTSTGALLSAKTVPALLLASARIVDGACEVSLPDGTATTNRADDVDAILSAWLDRPVALVTPEPGGQRSIAIEWDEGQDDPGHNDKNSNQNNRIPL